MHPTERMRLLRTAALAAGGLLLLAYAAVAQSLAPTALVDSYERAWGHHDIDGALTLLADNAVITVDGARQRTLTGREQIRAFLEDARLPRAPLPTTTRQVEATTLIWSERIEAQVLSGTELTVQAVVENGKIQSLVYRSGHLVGGAGSLASPTTPDAAAAVLGAVLLLGAGVLSLAGVRSQVRSGSNLRGRLLADLRVWSASPRPSLRASTLL
jgi:hypothetical protein